MMNQNTNEFFWETRVYYEDTDAGGIVYHANYLKFFERARSEWLISLGVDQAELQEQRVGFVVKAIDINYIEPWSIQSLDPNSGPSNHSTLTLIHPITPP